MKKFKISIANNAKSKRRGNKFGENISNIEDRGLIFTNTKTSHKPTGWVAGWGLGRQRTEKGQIYRRAIPSDHCCQQINHTQTVNANWTMEEVLVNINQNGKMDTTGSTYCIRQCKDRLYLLYTGMQRKGSSQTLLVDVWIASF